MSKPSNREFLVLVHDRAIAMADRYSFSDPNPVLCVQWLEVAAASLGLIRTMDEHRKQARQA